MLSGVLNSPRTFLWENDEAYEAHTGLEKVQIAGQCTWCREPGPSGSRCVFFTLSTDKLDHS